LPTRPFAAVARAAKLSGKEDDGGGTGDRGDYTFGSQLLQKALRPHRLEPATAVSEQQDPRQQQDSNLAVAIAGVVAVIATAAILYISGMFN
jgi:hypothetical protein